MESTVSPHCCFSILYCRSQLLSFVSLDSLLLYISHNFCNRAATTAAEVGFIAPLAYPNPWSLVQQLLHLIHVHQDTCLIEYSKQSLSSWPPPIVSHYKIGIHAYGNVDLLKVTLIFSTRYLAVFGA